MYSNDLNWTYNMTLYNANVPVIYCFKRCNTPIKRHALGPTNQKLRLSCMVPPIGNSSYISLVWVTPTSRGKKERKKERKKKKEKEKKKERKKSIILQVLNNNDICCCDTIRMNEFKVLFPIIILQLSPVTQYQFLYCGSKWAFHCWMVISL